MEKKQKFLLFIGIAFTSVLLTAFILSITGIIDLTIIATAEVSPVIDYCISFSLFMINMFFLFSISLKIFDFRISKILLIYIPLCIISSFLFDTVFISSTIIPFSYLMIISKLYGIKIKDTLINFGIFTLIIGTYQFLSIIIKVGIFDFGYNDVNTLVLIIYSIDLYLIYALYYMVVKSNAREFPISTETESVQKDSGSSKEILETEELTQRQRFIFKCIVIAFNVFQLLIVLSIGKINDRFIELLIILIVFWIGRIIMKKSYHSDSLIKCSMITFGGFYLLTKITLPLSISLFFCISLSALFVCILYYVAIYTDKYNEMHDTLYEFDLNTCSLYRLTERCRLVGLSEEDTHFCIDAFFKKKRNKELAELYEHRFANIEVIKYQKNKLKKKLNSI